MSVKERDRLDVCRRIGRKELRVIDAADELGLSSRQMKRVWQRFKTQGDGGLVHRARGRASNNRTPEDVRDRVAKIHQEHYADHGPTLACEMLAEHHQLVVGPDTLRGILQERGLWQPMRRRKKHRKHRRRRSSFGSMVQMDGSHHDWFEGRGASCVLMVLIDDATNHTLARFYPSEDLAAAFDAFGRWCRLHGVPRSLYVDRHSIYRDENDPQNLTQFGRAMGELGVRLICANSPQAKGRVERRNRLFQDRLVKEMRRRRIRSMSQGNQLLEAMFLKALNGRYSVLPARSIDLHRLPERSLAEVLCRVQERSVGNDWCVRWRNRWLQIEAEHAPLGLAGRRVEVRELGPDALQLSHKGVRLHWRFVPQRPTAKPVVVNNRHWKPQKNHAWVRYPACPGGVNR